MTNAEQIAFGALVIALVGQALTAFSIWMNYKSRTAHYQQKMYERKLEAVAEIMEALSRCRKPLFGFMRSTTNLNQKRTLIPVYQESIDSLDHVVIKHSAILPAEIVKSAMAMMAEMTVALTKHAESLAAPQETATTPDYEKISEAISNVISSCQAAIGTERIGENLAKLIGGTHKPI